MVGGGEGVKSSDLPPKFIINTEKADKQMLLHQNKIGNVGWEDDELAGDEEGRQD